MAQRLILLLLLLLLVGIGIEARGLIQKEQTPLDQPHIKVFQTAEGDIFDCVDIYKQPAFNHPLLKDHKLQLRPSSYPEDLHEEDSQESLYVKPELESEGCPDGTVPIMRVDKDIQQMKDIPIPKFASEQSMKNLSAANGVQSWYAQIKTKINDTYGGAADLNIYDLPNLREDQSSSTSIWISDADGPSQTRYSVVQAGVMANPRLYKDSKTRIYIHWTTDAYGNTGCYNTLCPGFVVTSKSAPLGFSFARYSTYAGQQYIYHVMIYKDKVSGNWWLSFMDNKNVIGYWPKEIFYDFDKGRVVSFGGSVTSPPGEPRPPMGNGHFFEEPNQQACFVKNVQIVDVGGTVHDLSEEGQGPFVTNPKCYSLSPYWEDYHMFRFGGNGAC